MHTKTRKQDTPVIGSRRIAMEDLELEECTMCGKQTEDLTVIDDETRVCEECLDDNFFACAKCGNYWLSDPDIYVETEDGELICPCCANP